MANTTSARKAFRQSVRKRKMNLAKKARVKRLGKELEVLLQKKEIQQAETLLQQAYKAIDKAAKTGVLKKNTAARKKSRLARLLAGLKTRL
ncbi:MAG: 30S ribosomal protein S20 [Parcubacteria group bacterium]|nr:30S ribosomal protein S20 [Parcubacteria group bacterium]MBI4217229.1 30S ribosomal protein S20 [Parcubacteria group bacterium]